LVPEIRVKPVSLSFIEIFENRLKFLSSIIFNFACIPCGAARLIYRIAEACDSGPTQILSQ